MQRSTIIRRWAERVPDALPVLALAAAGLARLVPSHAIADHVDLLLAALVLLTALDIDPRQLTELAGHVRTIVLLVIVPACALAALGWLISRFVAGDLRDGVLALGFAPAEVASVGLIGLIGGMAEAAIAVVGLSLVVSAVAGPPLLAAIAGGAQAARPLALLGHFALIVLLPLLAGLVIRGLTPALARRDAEISLGSTLIAAAAHLRVADRDGGGHARVRRCWSASRSCRARLSSPGSPSAPSADRLDPPLALTIGMRDFAVAAALAAAAFGPRAAQVAGVYGTVMLVAAAIVSALLARATPRTRR